MKIIPITNGRDLPKGIEFRHYCAETSPEEAVQTDREKFGSDPEVVYIWVRPSGRSTVYVPVRSAEIVIGSVGVLKY